MGIEKIEQYRAIKNEIKMLENQVKKLSSKDGEYASDVVKGSSAHFPFTKRSFVISGYDTSYDKTSNIHYRIQKLRRTLDEIELCVDTINDSEIRQIIQYKYFDGLTWKATATKVYGHPVESTPRRKFERFFEKI